MELPLCLVYIENDIIIEVNNRFDESIKEIYVEYNRLDIVNKKIKDIFHIHTEYLLIYLPNFSIYVRYMMINNIIAVNFLDSKIFDPGYFIHNTITPLTNAIELTKMFYNTNLTNKQREYLLIMKKNNFELTKNINNISKFFNYLTRGVNFYNEIIQLKPKINRIIEIISSMYSAPTKLDLGNETITADKEVFFNIMYHMLFLLMKNTGDREILISYKDKTIYFTCKSFSGKYIEILDNCNIHRYTYTDNLDIHLLKLLLILTKYKMDYDEIYNRYTLTFI